MKLFLVLILSVYSYTCSAQQVIAYVMANDKGITTNENKAKYLIIIQKYNDTLFERLEYNFRGPIMKKLTYKDSALTVLNGFYAEYSKEGYMSSDGIYENNKKEGSWHRRGDLGHMTLEYKYQNDELITVINVDSLKRETKEDTSGTIEASYPGGEKKFTELIEANFKLPKRTSDLKTDGTVIVRFIVGKDGKTYDYNILKSIEYAFDREALRVISLSAAWIPASRKGKPLNAFRAIPISITLN